MNSIFNIHKMNSLDAETIHVRLTGQEIVHSRVYLVGTIDRWNDSKRAELRDRTMSAHA